MYREIQHCKQPIKTKNKRMKICCCKISLNVANRIFSEVFLWLGTSIINMTGKIQNIRHTCKSYCEDNKVPGLTA